MFREEREKKEAEQLSDYAIKSAQAVREKAEQKHPYRTEFQRDRDRILHSKYFRLLMHKTQVFPSPELTYVRTRLTHTLEVTQIARTIARALNLNEDLTEAIGLGHDLGHPPFGHAGEEALKELMNEQNGFEHNEQSLRIVEHLEDLNLTSHVREGILRHTTPKAEYYALKKINRNVQRLTEKYGYPDERPTFFEAQVVDIADEIAYMTHDLDDLMHLKYITLRDIPDKWRQLYGPKRRDAIDGLVTNVITHANAILEAGLIDEVKTPIIFDEEIQQLAKEIKQVFKHIYETPPLGPKETEAKHYITLLFNHWLKEPCPEILDGVSMLRGEPIEKGIVDFIVQKTDQDITKEYEKLFSPRT